MIFLHAQKDLKADVLNDKLTKIGNDQHLTVANDSFTSITKNQHLTIQGECRLKVTKDTTEIIKGSLQQKVGGIAVLDAGNEIHLKSGTSDVVEIAYYQKNEFAVIIADRLILYFVLMNSKKPLQFKNSRGF